MSASEALITLTPAAVEAVREFKVSQNQPDATLIIGVKGGGCGGFQYALVLDHPADSDHVWEQDGIAVAVPAQAAAYVRGVTLDFVKELQNAGFKFENPNSTGSCGCGSSFRVDDAACPSESAL